MPEIRNVLICVAWKQAMRSRNLGGKGVDPREKKTTENLSMITADDIIMKTILPMFEILYEQQKDHTTVGETKLQTWNEVNQNEVKMTESVQMDEPLHSIMELHHGTLHCGISCHIPYTDMFNTCLPEITHFTVNEHESARNMILQLKQDCPDMCSSKRSFMAKMSELFELCDLGKGKCIA
jgi:hypothetical protein